MNKNLFYGVVFIVAMFSSCHTRHVSTSRLDSMAKHTATYTDLSTITTHTKVDTTFNITSHTITSTPKKVFVPFTVQDSLISISVSYDPTGNVIAQATAKARVLVAKVDQIIIRQNNIIAKTQEESHVIKKIKESKAHGMNIIAIVFICFCALGLIALLLHRFLK